MKNYDLLMKTIHISDFDDKELWRVVSPDELNKWEGTIKITLDYPFDKEYKIEIQKKADEPWHSYLLVYAIKEGFEHMYSKSKSNGLIPGFLNEDFTGEFGDCIHAIEDLFIEILEFNAKTGELRVGIGS